MTDLTREQEATIARLALAHPSVSVAPMKNGIVKVEGGGKSYLLDPDGQTVPEPVERAYMALPVDLLRRLLGDDVMDAALKDVATAAYPDHALATKLGDDVRARVIELLATSEAVRECGLGPAPTEAH
jgi:hypothetical protein